MRVGIFGATGQVGGVMRRLLGERDFEVDELRLFASARSAGRRLAWAGTELEVEDAATADYRGLDVALFSAGAAASRELSPAVAAAGAVVIDNSSAWRMDPEVPLVVVDVNDGDAAHRPKGIIANPNCTTMVLMMGLAPLHRAATLTDLIATSYQSVSGSGHKGIATLEAESEHFSADYDALRTGTWTQPPPGSYLRPIGFNVIPFAGGAVADGYTDEEMKLVNETRKILDAPGVRVEPTCVRVPVMVSHGVAATAWFERAVGVDEACALIGAGPGVELWQDKIPTPLDAAGRDEVLVGRVRGTVGRPGGISLWTVGDNLRKGAALNAVQIAELVVGG
jgi:aspartate-semialdehyde dehydrogenase